MPTAASGSTRQPLTRYPTTAGGGSAGRSGVGGSGRTGRGRVARPASQVRAEEGGPRDGQDDQDALVPLHGDLLGRPRTADGYLSRRTTVAVAASVPPPATIAIPKIRVIMKLASRKRVDHDLSS